MAAMASPNGLDEVHENPLKVSRRLIYLHRLVGDDVLTPKAKVVRPNPWRVTIVFFIYACSATMSILTYIDVGTLASINNAIENSLTKTPYKIVRGVEKFAEDVEQAQDIPEFILNAMVTDMLYGYIDEFPGAVRKNNRILSTRGFCENTSVIFLTMRRVNYDEDSEKTTGKRFESLYPKTWQGHGIAAGEETNDQENTTAFWGSYEHPLTSNAKIIPENLLGYEGYGKDSKPVTYERLETSRGRIRVWAQWAWSKPCHSEGCGIDGGLANAGGYVAAIVLQKTAAHQAIIDNMLADGAEVSWAVIRDIAKDMFVYLMDKDNGNTIVDPVIGTCAGGVKVTQVLRLEDFFEMGIFDRYCTSTSVHFTTYNAETQVMTEVEMRWNILQAGIVAYPFAVRTRSIKLDMRAGWYVVFEIIYILGCVFYFVELFVYKMYKMGRKLFSDVWTYVNMLSIVCSILSVAFRFQYGASNKAFLQDSTGYDMEVDDVVAEIRKENNIAALYQTFSALALVTIWLRVVELLAKTPLRVKLLETTLVKALASMVAYFCYIMVILAGFWAFVSVHFAAYSLEFSNPGKAFISCFQILCLNLLPYQTTRGAPLRVFFFFPYMFFSIISVQMFNSIINYAYNRTSDEMEPLMKRMMAEKKRQDKFKRGAMRTFVEKCRKVCGWCRKKCCSAKEKDEDMPETTRPAGRNEKELSQEEKDMVEEHKGDVIGKKNASEKCLPMFLYGAFALCYILFLGISLQIQSNGAINASISRLIYDTPFEILHASGSSHHRTFKEIKSLHDADMWISKALPAIVFEGSGAGGRKSPHDASFYDNSTHCLQNWNCLVKGRSEGDNDPTYRSLRITERMFKRISNKGTDDMEENDLPDSRFQLGGSIIPTRGPKHEIDAESPEGDDEDTTTQLNLFFEGRKFCGRGSHGFMRYGGIVCLLDSDRLNMTKQLEVMKKQGFYSSRMASIVVDFVTYNANTNSIVLVCIKFLAEPSGGVKATAVISAFSLLNVKSPTNDDGAFKVILLAIENAFSFDMLCGITYMVLVIYFVIRMVRDIYQETIKANFYDGTHWAVTVSNYFSGDIFHTLDLFSYLVSAISFALFCVWLAMQMHLKSTADGDISNFLSYIEELQGRRRLYKLLSSCNLLTICVRPLKFFRNDPRMRKLNLTFHRAKVDILWFNIMLIFFMAGFVLFAHIIFGIHKHELADVLGSCVYCFKFLIGSFNFWDLWIINGTFAMFFVFSFLFLFKFFFLNIFFAILDKNFVTGDAPPMNVRHFLKPIFGRIIRWVDWDADLNMEDEAAKGAKDGPPSRADRAHKYALQIAEARNKHNFHDESGTVKKSKALNDVCEVDDRMSDVLRWSREEAKKFVETFRKLQDEKQHSSNDEVFLKTNVKAKFVDSEFKIEQEAMNEAERMHRYAILVNEKMAERDQEILAKYILRLEYKMDEKMKEYKALNTDVHHLYAEAANMSKNKDQLMHMNEQHQVKDETVPEETKPPATATMPLRNDTDEPDEEEEQRDDEQGKAASAEGPTTRGQLEDTLEGFLDIQ